MSLKLLELLKSLMYWSLSWVNPKQFLPLLALFGLIAPSTIRADSCQNLFENSKNDYIVSNSYRFKAQKLNDELGSVLNSMKLNPGINWETVLIHTDSILKHAYQNAIQHGIKHGEQARFVEIKNEDYNSINTEIQKKGSYVILTISNPKIKFFPWSLRREFSVGEGVTVPSYQRWGFRGSGNAHQEIFDRLAELPSGSSVRWMVKDGRVWFILKLRTD